MTCKNLHVFRFNPVFHYLQYLMFIDSSEYNMFNSFTATGDNNKFFANSIDPDETAHLDLRCLTFILSTVHINVYSNCGLLK